MSAARIAVLDAFVNKRVAEEIAAHGLDPAFSGVLHAEAVKLLTSANFSADNAQLVKEWSATMVNVLPFRPRAAPDPPGGAAP